MRLVLSLRFTPLVMKNSCQINTIQWIWPLVFIHVIKSSTKSVEVWIHLGDINVLIDDVDICQITLHYSSSHPHLLLPLGISLLNLQQSSQWAGLWSMQHSPLETWTWATLSVPAPAAVGGWIGQVSEKASRGKKGACAAHLPDKRFNHPTLHTLHPLRALGTSWSQPPQLPAANIPSHRCDGLSLRGRAMIELEVILIITHLRHMQPFGARVKSISWARHICRTRGAVIRRTAATYSHNPQPALQKI